MRAVALFELTGVEKRYGELRALKDIDLSVEPGRIGLLGPNGAGKSTLLKTLLGLVQHDHGTVKVFDKDVTRDPFGVRALVGYMPEGDSVLPELTALQFTTLAAELCGLPRAEAIARSHQVLHYVGLGEARYRRLGPALAAFLPAVLAATTALGALALLGFAANLMHLVALLLVLSMGVDYGIFMVESRHHPEGPAPTVVSLVVACVSTVLSFGLLAMSDNPALQALGLVTGIGVTLSLLLAPTAWLLLGRDPK